ncbi:MAG: flagellar hook-length control protein FliK [Pseudomonadota bacterium]|nr:flagellar hook-length control protein FliK [Pseudomonadota bacterium]
MVEPVRILMSKADQAAPTASHVTTIQITPVELGRVDIRIERSADGPAKIQLVAERPETLSRLVHDQTQLQQALDQAGVPQSGRTLEFSLAPPVIADTSASTALLGGNTSGGSSFGSEPQRQGGAYDSQNLATSTEAGLTAPTNLRSMRNGIDITA